MTTEKNRIVVLGTGGLFTCRVVKTLLDNSCVPLAYIQAGCEPGLIPSSFADIPLHMEDGATDDELTRLLDGYAVPRHFQSGTDLKILLQQLDIHFLVVACWPKLIPARVIQSVSKAALNLHPSLLPRYRGIDPVNAQLSAGDTAFGVTLHLLSNRFDQGDIVLQQAFRIKGKATFADINIKAATLGAGLFLQAVNTFHKPGWHLQKQ